MIFSSCVLHSLVIFGSKKFHNWGFGRPSLIGFQPSVSNRNRSSVSWSGNSHFTFTPNRYPNSQHVSPCKFMSTRQFPCMFKSATLNIFNDRFFGGDVSRVAPPPFRSEIDIRTSVITKCVHGFRRGNMRLKTTSHYVFTFITHRPDNTSDIKKSLSSVSQTVKSNQR
jgi:hypothetical protein